THQPAANRDVVLELNALFETDREAVHQLFPVLIQQQNREHLVINQLYQQIADALKQLVEIQDRRQLAADLVEDGQRARLARNTGVQARVLDTDSNARCNQREQPRMFFLEIAFFRRLQVNDSDHAVFGDQW